MKIGKITKVFKEKSFFFIDDDYFCHFSKYSVIPNLNHIVEYEPFIKPDGKKEARNVTFIKIEKSDFDTYMEEVENGYFDESGSIAPEFIINYPKFLVSLFRKSNQINKPTQIRRYYDNICLIKGKYIFNRNFEKTKSELYSLVPIANKAKTKGYLSDEFYQFFEKNINNACNSPKVFLEGFLIHFQSIIGYYGE